MPLSYPLSEAGSKHRIHLHLTGWKKETVINKNQKLLWWWHQYRLSFSSDIVHVFIFIQTALDPEENKEGGVSLCWFVPFTTLCGWDSWVCCCLSLMVLREQLPSVPVSLQDEWALTAWHTPKLNNPLLRITAPLRVIAHDYVSLLYGKAADRFF